MRHAERIAWLARQRLLPYALAMPGSVEPGTFDGALAQVTLQARESQVALDRAALTRTLKLLGPRVLVLKGVALAHWLYERPHWRPSTDIDLLIPREDRLAAHDQLVRAGYASDGYGHLDAIGSQATYIDPASGRAIDLHWALSNLPEFAHRLHYAELDADAQSIPALANARGLGRVHALMHAVMHYFGHQPADERPAIWLLDIAGLAQGLDVAGWHRLDAEVRRLGLAGLHAAAFAEVSAWFVVAVDELLIASWREHGHVEPASLLLRSDLGAPGKLMRALRCLPDARTRLHFLFRRAWPPRAWMRGRYQTRNSLDLASAYVRRWLSVLRGLLR